MGIVRPAKFRVLALAALLAIAVASVAGITFSSSSAGGQTDIQATVYADAVRFAAQDRQASILRAEIFNLGGG